jgi:hypothetical protein
MTTDPETAKPSLCQKLKNLVLSDEFSIETQIKIMLRTTPCQMCRRFDPLTDVYPLVNPGKTGPRNKEMLVMQGLIPRKYKIWGKQNGMILCHECYEHLNQSPEVYDYAYLKTIVHKTIPK